MLRSRGGACPQRLLRPPPRDVGPSERPRCEDPWDMIHHSRQVTAVSVDWDTFQAMSASIDRTIILWDLEVGEPLSTYAGHSGSVCCLSVDWAGRRMASGAGPGDNRIRVWDFSDGYCASEVESHEGTVWAVDCDWAAAHKAVADAAGVPFGGGGEAAGTAAAPTGAAPGGAPGSGGYPAA
ncbi:unnamed protein product [Prorocentrum cordatum]|uniref:Peroxin-7 n=1 Tax=Prorocentrum cordatum TaxID=2364126 RepID=A0ABN9RJT1_9DINO|nr:unnamed protein product [Polarella glacialis]